ncbi:hypothetical protein HAX54_019449 [Datura stramonium]|uniref:Terpene synthase metal-binding domain-containing protein n=1 Tax=Datura stramonium TaxID=4076 RepID=A0ABS8URM1_DATST|nr:hypothetical protein [Datura stramonium]
MIAKTIGILSIVDDTYDAYGTIEELATYTNVIQSYKTLLHLYEDFEKELSRDGRSNVVYYAKGCDNIRVIDDVATYEVEKSRGQIVTGIECYKRDYGKTTEEAMIKFHEMAETAWKDVNEGILRPTPVSMEFLTRILNLARLIDVIYKQNQDGYTHPEKVVKPHIIALLVDPS